MHVIVVHLDNEIIVYLFGLSFSRLLGLVELLRSVDILFLNVRVNCWSLVNAKDHFYFPSIVANKLGKGYMHTNCTTPK